MITGVYCGHDERLKGKTALLQECKNNSLCWDAQFDDTSLYESHGWHHFSKTDFNQITESNPEDWNND